MDHGSVMVILINSEIQGLMINKIIYINKYNKKYLKIFIKLLMVCRCFLIIYWYIVDLASSGPNAL